MHNGATLFLKLAVLVIGASVLALCIFGLPQLAIAVADSPAIANLLYPVLTGMYVSAIPFFFALHQSLKLLTYIEKSKAFSVLSVHALKNIKYCAFTISIVYTLVLPFFYVFADLDDAPGVMVIGMVPIFASIVIAVFAAVLQNLLQEAIDIKSENE